MLNLQNLRTLWVRLQILYHRTQAQSYMEPVVLDYRRDRYHKWMHTMCLRHVRRARELEQGLTSN